MDEDSEETLKTWVLIQREMLKLTLPDLQAKLKSTTQEASDLRKERDKLHMEVERLRGELNKAQPDLVDVKGT
ncbi:hypothetical protein HDV00_009337 [Rhizophlyctis rosea]|nr:hypothetical protein HDV00_009337 [Rhizophlyctis rosea]